MLDAGDARYRSGLRAVVERFRPGVRLTPNQDVLLTDMAAADRAAVEQVLREHGVPLAEEVAPLTRRAAACPALPTCGLALTEAERSVGDVLIALQAELDAAGLGERGAPRADDRLPQRLRPALHRRDRRRTAGPRAATTCGSVAPRRAPAWPAGWSPA